MSPLFSLFFTTLYFTLAHSATFDITNKCPYTVWAAAFPGGGRRLNTGQTWIISANLGTAPGRIWARTNCQFDASGRGKCETGDCDGLLECQGFGQAPNTLAEYALGQAEYVDFFDISNVDGFNVPMEFSSASGSCSGVIRCTGDIIGQCPVELKVAGGCNNPCTVYKTTEYCCNGGRKDCHPTDLSKFFKDRCPHAYSYPRDDQNSSFSCPTDTNYKVTFCP